MIPGVQVHIGQRKLPSAAGRAPSGGSGHLPPPHVPQYPSGGGMNTHTAVSHSRSHSQHLIGLFNWTPLIGPFNWTNI